MVNPSRANTSLAASNQPAIVQSATVQNVFIGGGCPPVPVRLVKKIESGAFVEMAELLPEQLGGSNDDDSKVMFNFHTRMAPVLFCLCCSAY